MDPPALCTLSLTALIAGRDGIALSPYFVLRFLELSRNQTMVPLSFFFSLGKSLNSLPIGLQHL